MPGRLGWLFTLAAIIALGLLSRTFHLGQPLWDKYLGDALYAAHAHQPLGSDGATITRYRPDGAKPFTVARRITLPLIMANLIALFYNWWNLYVRFYDGERHREAVRSRPMLM